MENYVLATWVQTKVTNTELTIWEVCVHTEVMLKHTKWEVVIRQFPYYKLEAISMIGTRKLEYPTSIDLSFNIACKKELCSKRVDQGKLIHFADSLQWEFKTTVLYKIEQRVTRPTNQFQQEELYSLKPDYYQLKPNTFTVTHKMENCLLGALIVIMPYQHINNICRLKGMLYRDDSQGTQTMAIQTPFGQWTLKQATQSIQLKRCVPPEQKSNLFHRCKRRLLRILMHVQ